MKRRNFIQASAAASTIPLTYTAASHLGSTFPNAEKELYEIRTYEMKFGSNAKLLVNYLKNALHPAMKRVGVNHFLLFNELSQANPTKIWVLISYPSANIYLQSQNLQADSAFVKASMDYTEVPAAKPLFNRFSSMLLHAFDGLPQMMSPKEGASIFELRTYEGYSEDAVRRKIKMFDKEELPVFLDVGLHPVFFGNMISGPYRPALTYMLNFKDMEERDANWGKFFKHPDWNTMKVKEEYANTVSNIRRDFLKPM